jgi:signal transduction histidine kinase
VKTRLTDALVGTDVEKAHAMLAELQEGLTDALDTLRDLAHGIYPPLLADRGLPAALESHARKSGLPVMVTTEGVERYPQEAEAAVYFCCLEALQNASKYANASRLTIRLWSEDDELLFSVTDDGRGFDTATAALGAGVQNMSDRLAALGGSLDLASEPGRGTTVTGRVPARSIEPIVRAAP